MGFVTVSNYYKCTLDRSLQGSRHARECFQLWLDVLLVEIKYLDAASVLCSLHIDREQNVRQSLLARSQK